MRVGVVTALLVCAGVLAAHPSSAYPARTDVIWARQTNGAPIVLDGKLDEAVWAQAETKQLNYRVDAGIPGSGWKEEGGVLTADSVKATLKFLAIGNRIYLGAVVKDRSIGGSKEFNRFDGFLMGVKDHSLGYPTPVQEYLYSWWYPADLDSLDPGQGPAFKGVWAVDPPGSPRTPEQIDAWDAVTTVQGVANQDSVGGVFVADTSYTVEMMFNMAPIGYDITDADGDVFEWNISIYDCDYFWPINIFKFASNRTWWQSPWGNVGWYHEVRVYSRPSVTVTSGPVPEVAPELIVPVAAGFPPPTIDGQLTESVWASAPSIPIRYGDDLLRESYPGIARWRAGQYQPSVNGGTALVEDPTDCTVKYFFKEDTLYLGFDFNDAVVQYYSLEDRWDGFVVSINDRGERNPDRVLFPRKIACRVGPTGQADPQDYLNTLINDLGGAEVAFHMNAGTTVDTLGLSADNGYQAELKLDLTKLGYPHNRGDGVLYLGVCIYDGDSFTPSQNSTATRTWWFREREGTSSSCWAYMDPSVGVLGVDDGLPGASASLELASAAPNPFRERTLLRFSLPTAGRVDLDVFDLQGRVVASRSLGRLPAGPQVVPFDREGLGPGLYLYRVRATDAANGAPLGARSGKLMLVR